MIADRAENAPELAYKRVWGRCFQGCVCNSYWSKPAFQNGLLTIYEELAGGREEQAP